MSPTTVPGNFVIQSPAANDPLLDLNTQPSLDLQFATSKTLDDRVSGLPLVDHQRDASGSNSPGTYVGSDGLIKTSKVNLLRYSEEFNDTYWFKRNSAAIVPNAVVSPDGNTTADELQHPGGSTYARIETTGATPSVTLNASYSFTIYAKYKPSSDANYLAIQFQRASGVSYINLSTKTVDSGDGDVELLGSGWIRFRRTLVATSTGTNQVYIYPTNTTNTSPINIAANAGLYIWGAQLEEGSTASSYIKTTNLPSAAPRFDHDPTTNASLGLLVEESRENLVTDSASANNWVTFSSGAVSASTTVCPDGSTDATRLTASALNDGAYKTFTAPSSGDYIGSCYARTRTGVATDVKVALSGPTGSTVTLPADGTWIRVIGTSSSLGAGNKYLSVRSAAAAIDIDVWGLQAEFGAFPTSYIPTSGSTVTRAADAASITGSNFSRWYNQGEGTFIATHEETSTRNVIGAVYGGGAQLRLFSYLNTTRVQFLYGSGTGYFGYSSSPSSPPAYVKTAFYYDGLSYGGTIQGLTPSNLTTTTAPSPSLFEIGRANNVYTFNGRIPRLTYYPYRLSDATLQEITS